MSRSRSPGRAIRRALAAGLGLLALAGAASAQPLTGNGNGRNGNLLRGAPSRDIPRLSCAPGDTRPVCTARRATIQPNQPVATRLLHEDTQPKRFIPPKIVAFLSDPRVDPVTRAFLQRMSGKPLEDWTVAELEMVTAVVPTLTEMRIPTAVLSDFYEFLGLDPANLFNPQLGQNWQERSISQDARNLYAAERSACFSMLGIGGVPDASVLTLGQVAACNTEQ